MMFIVDLSSFSSAHLAGDLQGTPTLKPKLYSTQVWVKGLVTYPRLALSPLFYIRLCMFVPLIPG